MSAQKVIPLYTAQQAFDLIVRRFNDGTPKHPGAWFNPNNEREHCVLSSLFYGTEKWNDFAKGASCQEGYIGARTFVQKHTGLSMRAVENIISLYDTSSIHKYRPYQINLALETIAQKEGLDFNYDIEQIELETLQFQDQIYSDRQAREVTA